MSIHQRERQQDVAQVLAHLAAVLGHDVTEADHVLVRGPSDTIALIAMVGADCWRARAREREREIERQMAYREGPN